MSINTYRSAELMAKRKEISDIKNDTDDLIFLDVSKKKSDPRSTAYRKNRDRAADFEIKQLEKCDDLSELKEMLKDV